MQPACIRRLYTTGRKHMDEILELENISKRFYGIRALDAVSMKVKRGTVHAVVGENGAGKSTLMKILGGLYKKDSGLIKIKGREIKINSVLDAERHGISVIYQEFNLVPYLTVAENIFLSRLPKKGVVIDTVKLFEQTRRLMENLGINIDPGRLVQELAVSEMQMVEIAKAISYNSEIIIMDEPTAALNDKEVENLFRLIRQLKEEEKTVIYISHRMKEIFSITDEITVLRDGKKAADFDTNQITEEKLIGSMIGRDIKDYYNGGGHIRKAEKQGEVFLRVNSLTKKGVYEDISFTVHKGEILGLGGLMGCRREEVVRTLFGLFLPDSGEIELKGKKLQLSNPMNAISNGIMYVTDDRKGEGIFAGMSVKDNLSAAILDKLSGKVKGIIDRHREENIVRYYTDYMDIKYSSVYQTIVNLSGGNQQKVLLARALATGCEVLILLEPTRGIDVGAKAEIYRLLRELAKKGMAIILVTSETNELITLCDKVIVIFQGRISGELVPDKGSQAELTEENLMFCSTGNKKIFYSEVSA